MAWVYVAYFVVALVISFALTPKPNTPMPGVGNVTAPTASVGKEIPVVFGTVIVKSANVVWYGDIKTVPVKSKGGKK